MSDDTLDLIAQGERAEQAKRTQEWEEQRAVDDLRFVMSSEQGRREVWRTLGFAGLWRSSFTGDRNNTDFREGQRNIALWLWARLLRACPEQTTLMQQENQHV